MKTLRNRWLLPILLLGPGLASLFAQTTLTGAILDDADKPLAYASILLLHPLDSSLVKGAVADGEGKFIVREVEAGDYLLSAIMVGYQHVDHAPLQLDGSLAALELKPVIMRPAATNLETVEVTGRKPLFEQQADRLVVNVQSSITSAGNTALQVLERSPGILVDRQNYSISMNGKSGVIVMINGKRSRMDLSAVVQMLEGMNAGNIDRIELITSPPARYDADGDAGIIHIVLKEQEGNGLNGSYSAFAGYGARPKVGGSLNLNLRRGMVNLFGNVSYNNDWSRSWSKNHRGFLYQGVETLTDTRLFRPRPNVQFVNGQLGLDVNLSPKTVIGVLFGGYMRDWETEDSTLMNVYRDLVHEKRILTLFHEDNLWSHYMGNVNVQHAFTADKVLNFDLDRLHYFNDNPSRYLITEGDLAEGTTNEEAMELAKQTPITVWVAKLDYRQSLGSAAQWEVGLKGTHSQFNNTVILDRYRAGDWAQDSEFSQDFQLRERIGAAYTSFQFQFNGKHQLSLGLRYEFTDTQLDSVQGPRVVDREYGSFFPTVFYSYQLAENQALQFSYNRRITRPTFNELAPFVIFLDPFTFVSGNSNLRASFTDAVRLGYTLKNFTFALQYSYDKFPIAGFQPEVDPGQNQQVFAAKNLDYRHNFSGTVTFPVYIGSWWEMQNSATASWQRLQGSFSETELQVDQRSLQINSTQTFKLPHDLAVEVSAFYRSPTLFGIFRWRAMTVVNLGLQKRFPKINASLSLNLSDILNQNMLYWEIDQPELYLEGDFNLKFETRILRLTFTQTFGSSKVKKARQRQTGSSAEQNRVTQ